MAFPRGSPESSFLVLAWLSGVASNWITYMKITNLANVAGHVPVSGFFLVYFQWFANGSTVASGQMSL
jgi:hypothetical protein